MPVDIVYLAWNRREFTQTTFQLLLANTDWGLVDRLIVYDDGSTDGTDDYLAQAIRECPVEYDTCGVKNLGPPGIMNHYIRSKPRSDWWVKIDNDIALPPRWLNALLSVSGREPHWDCIGIEAGRMGIPGRDGAPWDGVYRAEPARWIGGVGLIRTSILDRRQPLLAQGRFGWTQAQMRSQWSLAWIAPDLMVPQLDRVPVEPFRTWSAGYIAKGWQRAWPQMDPRWSGPYYDWIPIPEEVAA